MYTDDASIYHSSNDTMQLNTALKEELQRLDRWLKRNKLSLNVAKTRSMLMTTKQRRSISWLQTRGDQQPEQEPELDPEFSYLGRSLSRSPSGKFFKKPDQEPEPELC